MCPFMIDYDITIHEILTLDIPQGNYSACYDVDTKYLGITKDATMAVELSTTQFQACQEANGQFCNITTPFQPLANPPSCIASLYAKALWILPQMLTADMESIKYKFTYPNSTRCLGPYNTTCSSSKHHDINMS